MSLSEELTPAYPKHLIATQVDSAGGIVPRDCALVPGALVAAVVDARDLRDACCFVRPAGSRQRLCHLAQLPARGRDPRPRVRFERYQRAVGAGRNMMTNGVQ